MKLDNINNDPYSPNFSKIKKQDNNGINWFKLKVTNESKGTFIWAKSYELEEYFKQFGPEDPINYEMRNGYKPYRIPNGANSWASTHTINNPTDTREYNFSYISVFEQWNYESLYSHDRSRVPNLSFLRTQGLSQGVKFKINNIYTLSERTEFLDITTKIMRNFFLDFLRPNTKKLSLSYRTEDSDVIEDGEL